jgi:histidine triad (HIT) family protein
MALDPNCIFCKIIEGQIPAEIVYRSENVVAFNDLNPQAPTKSSISVIWNAL